MQLPNEKLYLLISKLSASEKGYINKRLKTSNPDSHLIKLFVAICKVKPCMDAELRKKIKVGYITKNLAIVKNQLLNGS